MRAQEKQKIEVERPNPQKGNPTRRDPCCLKWLPFGYVVIRGVSFVEHIKMLGTAS